MRSILVTFALLLAGCNRAADTRAAEARYIAQFRADGIQSCLRGEGLMQPRWAVPEEQLDATCRCIVAAFTEGKTRRTLQHLSVTDQLRARERCSNGAPLGASPREKADAAMMDEAVNVAILSTEGNTGGAKR